MPQIRITVERNQKDLVLVASRKLLPPDGNRHGRRSFGSRLLLLSIAPVLILSYGFLLDKTLMTVIFLPLWMRYVAVFLAIFPVSFVMGMFFPVGVRILSIDRSDAIPWAWSVNAGTSVVASVMAVLIALSWGFTAVLCTAALTYSLAVLILWVTARAG